MMTHSNLESCNIMLEEIQEAIKLLKPLPIKPTKKSLIDKVMNYLGGIEDKVDDYDGKIGGSGYLLTEEGEKYCRDNMKSATAEDGIFTENMDDKECDCSDYNDNFECSPFCSSRN